MTDRAQPNDMEAEKAVLGAMLVNREAVPIALDLLTSEDFYRPVHGHIFDACVHLWTKGEPVDPTTVHGVLPEMLGVTLPDLLAIMTTQGYLATSVPRYAASIRNRKLLRTLIRVGGEIAALGWDGVGTDDALLLDHAETKAQDIATARHVKQRLARIGEGLDDWANVVDARQTQPGLAGISTGWPQLDAYLAGLRPGQLITTAARPSMGKSMWAGALALNIAGAGHPVLFVSAEMSFEELMDRFMAQSTGVALEGIRKGKVAPRDWELISHSFTRIADMPLYVADEATSTLFTIRSAARRVLALEGRLAVIIVDYLQLLTPTKRNENRQVEVAELSRGLKTLAMDLKVPVVSLAQLNRNLEMRAVADRRPKLSDLRESGAIENDSDIVMFLYRDEVYVQNSPKQGVCEVIIAKQRNGPLGDVDLWFDIRTGRFRAPLQEVL